MKQLFIITILVAGFFACTPAERTAEQVTAEIGKTRGKIGDLNVKLTELEAELAAMQTEETQSGVKVKTEMVSVRDFSSYINTSAMVEAVNAAMVSPEMNARILKIHVNEGQKVSKGQTLVTLDDESMVNSMAEIDKALELSKTMYEKQKDLYDQGVGSELQYLQAKNQYESLVKSRESLMTQLSKRKVVAPFSGYVETIYQKVGEFATPGRQIAELVSLSSLYLNTELSETYIDAVNKGDTVWLSFPNLPDLEKVATVAQVGKVINPASRTFSIRVDMNNPGEHIKPNMLANIKIKDYELKNAFVVPTFLIRQDINGSFMYLARPHDGDYFAVKTYITTGRSDGTYTVVEDGLDQTALIVTSGFNQIKDGNQLDIVD